MCLQYSYSVLYLNTSLLFALLANLHYTWIMNIQQFTSFTHRSSMGVDMVKKKWATCVSLPCLMIRGSTSYTMSFHVPALNECWMSKSSMIRYWPIWILPAKSSSFAWCILKINQHYSTQGNIAYRALYKYMIYNILYFLWSMCVRCVQVSWTLQKPAVLLLSPAGYGARYVKNAEKTQERFQHPIELMHLWQKLINDPV